MALFIFIITKISPKLSVQRLQLSIRKGSIQSEQDLGEQIPGRVTGPPGLLSPENPR